MEQPVPSAAAAAPAPRGWTSLLSLGPFVVLGLVTLLTVVAWKAVDLGVDERVRTEFTEHAREAASRLAVRLHDDEQILRGGVGLFQASDAVRREEWRSYVSALRLDESFPGIQGVGFTEWIPAAGLSAHQKRVRAEGFPDYVVRPPGEREAYTSIVYLEPFDWRNQRAFGFDMFSEPVRRAAMTRARDTGEAAVSGRITLVQETEKDRQHGVLMYLPVYRKGAPVDSVERRRAALQGFVYSPIRVKDLVYGALRELPRDLAFEVFVGGEPLPEALVFDSLAAEPRALPPGWRPQVTGPGRSPA